MAYLIVRANTEEIDRRELTGPLVVGRSPECDLAVRDVLLSRRHCRLEPVRSRGRLGWQVVDLGSKNGTRLRWTRVTRQTLFEGDELRVGRSTLTFHAGDFVAPTGSPKARLVRPADPFEALSGTVTGFILGDEADEPVAAAEFPLEHAGDPGIAAPPDARPADAAAPSPAMPSPAAPSPGAASSPLGFDSSPWEAESSGYVVGPAAGNAVDTRHSTLAPVFVGASSDAPAAAASGRPGPNPISPAVRVRPAPAPRRTGRARPATRVIVDPAWSLELDVATDLPPAPTPRRRAIPVATPLLLAAGAYVATIAATLGALWLLH